MGKKGKGDKKEHHAEELIPPEVLLEQKLKDLDVVETEVTNHFNHKVDAFRKIEELSDKLSKENGDKVDMVEYLESMKGKKDTANDLLKEEIRQIREEFDQSDEACQEQMKELNEELKKLKSQIEEAESSLDQKTATLERIRPNLNLNQELKEAKEKTTQELEKEQLRTAAVKRETELLDMPEKPEGIVGLVLETLKAYPQNSRIHAEGLLSLKELASLEEKYKLSLFKMKGIDQVLSSMESFPEDISVLTNAITLIWKITHHDEEKTYEVGVTGIIELITKVLKTNCITPGDHGRLLFNALSLLLSMSSHEILRGHMQKKKVAEVVQQALNAYPEHTQSNDVGQSFLTKVKEEIGGRRASQAEIALQEFLNKPARQDSPDIAAKDGDAQVAKKTKLPARRTPTSKSSLPGRRRKSSAASSLGNA